MKEARLSEESIAIESNAVSRILLALTMTVDHQEKAAPDIKTGSLVDGNSV